MATSAEKYPSEYASWRCMRGRCHAPRNASYAEYGARGITVCSSWASFAEFLKDMGRKPSPSHTLERRANDKGYYPGNCRWATKGEQANNRRSSRPVLGYPSVAVACRELGLPLASINGRLRRGMSFEEALMKPPRVYKKGVDATRRSP